MPRRCVVPGCKSNYDSSLKVNNKLVATFSFPKDDELKKKWIRVVHRKDWQPTSYSAVCSHHFRDSDFSNGINAKSPRLVAGAIPSVFPNLPKILSKSKTVSRKPFSVELCGYVYFSESKSFIYCCAFCEMRLESAEELENHSIKEHLFLDGEIPTDLMEKIKSSSTVIHSNEDENNVLLKNSTTTFSDNTLNGYKIEEEYIVSEANDNILVESKGEVQDEGLNEEKISNDIDDGNLCCKYCQRQFNKVCNLKEHIKNHLNYILTCKICGAHSKRRGTAKSHFKTHSKLQCEFCHLKFASQKALETHTRRHEKLKCKYCNKVFKKMSNIKTHLRRHTGEKPYKCDVCSAAFVEKITLQTHFLSKHTGDVKNFACKFCDRRFKTKLLHDWHTKRVHLKEKPHQCELCGLIFLKMSDMKRHNLINHTDYDKRPHHCEYCNKKFIYLNMLTEHMNTHTGEKPFACDVCFKVFGQRNSLREHKKIHTEKDASCAKHMIKGTS